MQTREAVGLESLVRLDRAHVRPASAMLARSFRDYPLLAYVVPDATRREREAFYFCQYDLYYGFRYGEVYATSPQMEGVAVWVPSDYLPMTTARILGAVPWSCLLYTSPSPRDGLLSRMPSSA